MKALCVAVVSIFLVSCAGAPRATSPAPVRGFADRDIEALMARGKVVGLALAVIDDGQVTRVSAYGKRNLERDLPLLPDTVMYGASLTKTAFAYMLLQLASEGRLDLDAPLTKLLPKPLPDYRLGERRDFSDLAGDARWRQLTPRILLTHAGGFANFRWLEPDEKLRFHFTPGERYAYSAEGMYILQLIVEQGQGLDAGREMQVRVFDRLGMRNTSMQWRPDFAANLADGYTLEGRMEPHDQRSAVTAAGSMDTTIADQARMWAAIVRGDGLSPEVRAEMVRPQLPILGAGQFPTLVSRVGAPVPHLAAGLGVVTFQDRSGTGWFKGGHNDSTGNMAICLEAGRRCVVMLSNDVRAERLFPEIARLALGANDMPWRWEYGWYVDTP
ncbi:serine hydrolase [Massilia sp. HP4]|uniref:serine hydrolase domain-containing protein n=1 Tax=Massilia sp. HP4 TaxID=2562316 RepID=UPI0010BF6D2B|nr:serine hydrolase domain-containing protein [Massilia sp. HP4]